MDFCFCQAFFSVPWGLASEVVCEDALPRMTYQGPRSVFLSPRNNYYYTQI